MQAAPTADVLVSSQADTDRLLAQPAEPPGPAPQQCSGRHTRATALQRALLLLLGGTALVVLLVVVWEFAAQQSAGSVTHMQASAGDGHVRLAVLADVHMAGPQYELGTESNELDNQSVIKTQQRLWRTVQAVNAISPRPDLALFLGDVVHNGLDYSADFRVLTQGPINGYHISSELLELLEMPSAYQWGNHDYKVTCGSREGSAPRALSARLFRHFFKAQPYSAVDVGGWKIVMLNSLLGHTWDYSHPDCNTRLSSYGSEQLAWLEGQLAEGRYTVVGLHFPLPTSVREGDTSLMEILMAHSNVKLVISGHFHKGFDWEDLYPFTHVTLPAVRYDEHNFFLLELDPQGTARFLDLEKNRGGARCSDTWKYDGEPAFVNTGSRGDCGTPSVADTPSYVLPQLNSSADIPASFNPEASCSSSLATAFLEECTLQGASQGCCDLLTTQFAPSSSWPFASCLCQPTFWKNAETLFRRAGRDAGAVADECIAQTGKVILRRGAGSCPMTPP